MDPSHRLSRVLHYQHVICREKCLPSDIFRISCLCTQESLRKFCTVISSPPLRCGGGDSAQLELPFCQFFPSSSFRPGRKEHLVRPSFEVAFYNIWSKLFMDNCYVNHLKLEFVNLWSLHLWKKIYILFEYPLLSINLTLAWSQQNQVSKLLYFIDCAKALHSLSLPKAVGSQPSRGRTINPRPS